MTALIFLLLVNFIGTSQTPIILDQAFSVTKGESAHYTENDLSIKVLKIMDSRCPENTNCIWAGELSVELELTENKSIKTYVLTIPASGSNSSKARMKINDYTLVFLGQINNKSKKEITSKKDSMILEFILSSEEKSIDEK